MTASTAIVKLEVKAVAAVMSSWILVAPYLTVKRHPDQSLVTVPSVYTMRFSGFWFS